MGSENNKSERKKLIIQAGIAIVILVIIVIIGLILGRTGGNSGPDGPLDTGIQGEEEDDSYTVAFPDITQIRDVFQDDGAIASMLSGVQNTILLDDEIAKAPQKNKPASGFGENVFTTTANYSRGDVEISFPYTVYSMAFKTSDGRFYAAKTVFTNEKSYATLINRTSPSQGKSYLYVTVNNYNPDRDAIIDDFITWAKGERPGEKITVTTTE